MHRLLTLLLLGAVAQAASADEFRSVQPIATRTAAGEPAAAAAPVRRPVAAEVVEAALAEFFAAWNTPAVFGYVADDFQDRSRLLDVLSQVPRDARLRLLSVDSVATLEQRAEPVPGRDDVILLRSTVAAVVRSQVEFNDPISGFVRREGTNEYVFEIIEAAAP